MEHIHTNFEDEPVYHALMTIRKKPGLWLGAKSLRALDSFIHGYMAGITAMKTPFYDPDWYRAFEKYVALVCAKGNECYGVANAIFECGYDDEEGFDYFYQLVDAFVQEQYSIKYSSFSEKQTAGLNSNEMRVLRIGLDAILEIANHYILDHIQEIFDLPSDNEAIHDTICNTFLNPETNVFTCVVCDRADLETEEDIRTRIRQLELTTDSVFHNHPYVSLNKG